MGTYRQTFLYNFATLVTLLRGETWVHSNDLMTSSRSLVVKDFKELTPIRMRTLRWGMFSIRFCLTDNERIPVSISTQDQMT
jgi:hypothetical protein